MVSYPQVLYYLWITFYDTESYSDSLWLEDSINSSYKNGVQNDILNLIYKMNHKAEIVAKTTFGDCNPIFVEIIVRQGTGLGPCFEQLVPGRGLS